MLLQALCIIWYPLVNSNWSYSPETPNLGQIRWFLEPCDLEIWRMTLQNNRAPLLCYFKLCAAFRSHWWIQTGVTVRKIPIWVKFRRYLELCDLEIWRTILQNNRAPLLCYFKLCAAFRSHWWIQTGVTVRKIPIWVKFRRYLEPCDLEIWRMTLQNNRAPLLCYSSFVHHFIPIGEFKFQLQSGNAQFGSKLVMFCTVWPWNLMDNLGKQ